MTTFIRSNAKELSARYRRMAKAMPGIEDGALEQLVVGEAIPLFQKTVATWQHRPTFEPVPTPRGWSVKAQPSQPFGWVNAGTRPHTIRAHGKGLLRFTLGGKAKTRPGVIASQAGRRGSQWASKRKIRHPGSEARDFSTIILTRLQARAAAAVRAALNKASYGSGQGL